MWRVFLDEEHETSYKQDLQDITQEDIAIWKGEFITVL